jgi:hypothetical protein
MRAQEKTYCERGSQGVRTDQTQADHAQAVNIERQEKGVLQ